MKNRSPTSDIFTNLIAGCHKSEIKPTPAPSVNQNGAVNPLAFNENKGIIQEEANCLKFDMKMLHSQIQDNQKIVLVSLKGVLDSLDKVQALMRNLQTHMRVRLEK